VRLEKTFDAITSGSLSGSWVADRRTSHREGPSSKYAQPLDPWEPFREPCLAPLTCWNHSDQRRSLRWLTMNDGP